MVRDRPKGKRIMSITETQAKVLKGQSVPLDGLIETFKKYRDAIVALDVAEREMDRALKPVMEAIRASGDKAALKELIRLMPKRR